MVMLVYQNNSIRSLPLASRGSSAQFMAQAWVLSCDSDFKYNQENMVIPITFVQMLH